MKLYHHATFVPMDGTSFDALLVDDHGIIAYTGSYEDAFAYAQHLRQTQPDALPVRDIDMQGATILPGFIDPHSHFSGASQYFTAADVSQATCIDDILRALRTFAREDERRRGTINPDEPLIAVGCDHTILRERRMPLRAELDTVSTVRPVVVNHVSGHNLSCNSRMLAAVHIDADTSDPTGGRYERDDHGNPDGRCIEPVAMQPIFTYIQAHSHRDAGALLPAMQSVYAEQGITTVQDGASTAHDAALFAKAADAGSFALDVVSYPMFGEDTEAIFREHTQFDTVDYHGHLRFGGVKIFMDGSPQARTAWLSAPYLPGDEGEHYCGHATVDLHQVQEFTDAAVLQGRQVLCHCNGDAAGDAFMDVMAQSLSQSPHTDTYRLRPVMIHAQFARRDQFTRMRSLGMMPSFFTGHTWYWADTHIENMGRERAMRISPVRDALDAGLPVTFHTDSPVIRPNLLEAVWCAAARISKSGVQLDVAQRVDVAQGLRAITLDAAYQYGEERRKGSLSVGKLADMAVLAANPLTASLDPADPCCLRDLRVLATIKEGRTVWHAPDTPHSWEDDEPLRQ